MAEQDVESYCEVCQALSSRAPSKAMYVHTRTYVCVYIYVHADDILPKGMIQAPQNLGSPTGLHHFLAV